MPSEPSQRAQAPRILVVADSGIAAQAIVERLGSEFDAAARLSVEPGRAPADAAEIGAEVVLLGLGSLAAAEREARSLRARPAAAGAPILLVLCDAGDLAAAARLTRDGSFDDYLAHPGDAADPDRLATSVRIAVRLARAGARPRPATRARPVVLLVEDDEFSHQLVAISLEGRNVELVYEADGAAALERIRNVQPDLVLMDVMLPGRDGLELTQELKADPALAAIPVVMLTGEARREILARSVEAGAADFIVKPFTPDALIAKLLRFLPGLR
ncbi:MAG: response regulator [Caldimonas sp.]